MTPKATTHGVRLTFASKSLVEHLFRGAVGLSAFAFSAVLGPDHPWIALALVPVALFALRGCPLCWTIGLFQTAFARLRGINAGRACADGRCAVGTSSAGER